MDIAPDALFAALGNPTRLRCLLLLAANEELCVCELTHVVGAAQPNISRHLAQLRELQLVADHREGQWIYYRLNPALPDWIVKVLQDVVVGAGKRDPYHSDQIALTDMPNRPGSQRCA